MNKPIIGIVAKHDIKSEKIRTNSLIRDEVKQAIFDNDAIAIGILSANNEIQYTVDDWTKFEEEINKKEIIEQIKLCNGIILQGGNSNEAYENWIAKYCYENDIPVLGICAGQNSIVRALGGTTYSIKNKEKHNQSKEKYVHSITIEKSSKFYNIIGKEKIMVNSRHNKDTDKCPKLKKVAFCEDGYADVVESNDKLFYIGTRFHPESLYKIDENMNKIFKSFIEVCKNN